MAGMLVAAEEKVGVVLDVESTALSIGLRVMLEAAGLAVSTVPSVDARYVVMRDASRIVARSREANLLAILAEAKRGELESVVDAGASGAVLRDVSVAELVSAVETVARGGMWFSPTLSEIMAEYIRKRRVPAPESVALTQRQRAVLDLLVQGDSTAEIARRLCIAQQTVKQHVSMLIGLHGVRSRVELVAKVTGHHRSYCSGSTVGALDHGRS